ncbi:Ger(x)C family spore germination protein [Dehalobacter sp. TBBPA1]|uniref:Ger(x)C family spore germination protein n=1 Tax=Dehalobacter sp. TBBPA1 TaxID=3235037 RepID=UPI0034A42592
MKKNYRILGLFILIILQSAISTGCWSSKEVESLAVVTLMGVDYTNENGSDMWTISATILNPLGQDKEGGQSSGKGNQETLLVGTGRTINETISAFSAHSSRTPFYGHISAYIIGEKAAMEKMCEFTEAAIRYWGNRPRLLILVTKGKALEVLQAGPAVDKLLSKELKELGMNKASATGYSYGVTLTDFADWLKSPDRDPVATLVNVVPPEVPGLSQQNLMEGLAVFQGGRLIGWLNKDEAMGYLLITQNINGHIPLTFMKDDKLFSYYISTAKSKVLSVVTGDKISYHVQIKVMGGIAENSGLRLNVEDIKVLENVIEDRLRDLSMQAVDKAKKYDSDFLGFTEKLHRTNLSAWQTLGPDWRKAFRTAEVEIVVDAKIVQTGMMGE